MNNEYSDETVIEQKRIKIGTAAIYITGEMEFYDGKWEWKISYTVVHPSNGRSSGQLMKGESDSRSDAIFSIRQNMVGTEFSIETTICI